MPPSHSRTIDLLDAIRAMDQAISAHTLWLSKFHRALICAIELNPADLAPDSHHRCTFGRWYDELVASEWQQWARELAVIGRLHEDMHATAQKLAIKRGAGPAPTEEYDRFIANAIRFKNALRSLQFKIINDACLVDHLTGAWNRSSLLRRITEEYERRAREGGNSCLCMMDLDHFKNVNDVHGHAAGDEVLRAVVEIVKRRLRTYDSVFRYGGEEFLLCLPNITLDEAFIAVERLRQDIETADIKLANGTVVRISASFGIAQLCSQSSIEQSIEMADHALFGAKARGRNNVCRWDIDCPADAAESLGDFR